MKKLETNHCIMSVQTTQTTTASDDSNSTVSIPKEEAMQLINLYCVMMGLDSLPHQKRVLDSLVDGPSSEDLTESDCSALAFCLMMAEEVQGEVNAGLYRTTLEGRQRLIAAVKNCRKAVFKNCSFSDRHWEVISLALSSSPSNLRALDLGENPLSASALEALTTALKNPNCEILSLTLWSCGLTEVYCSLLGSALKSNPSHLQSLYVGGNKDMGDSGVEQLCAYLKDPQCHLQQLFLESCSVTKTGCDSLASALTSNIIHSLLQELYLDGNNLTDSDVKELVELQKNTNSRLKILTWK